MRPRPDLPQPGQESVWDYPRPPRAELTSKHIRVMLGGAIVADTIRAIKVMETSHPPTYYIPPQDITPDALAGTDRTSFCEYKGRAVYFDVSSGGTDRRNAAWSYPEPAKRYSELAGYVAFYPGLMDECTVDGEVVKAQPGDFYGGWITSDVAAPFKGEPGTYGW
jgi:uncharacterized protein (DUF427 family)